MKLELGIILAGLSTFVSGYADCYNASAQYTDDVVETVVVDYKRPTEKPEQLSFLKRSIKMVVN